MLTAPILVITTIFRVSCVPEQSGGGGAHFAPPSLAFFPTAPVQLGLSRHHDVGVVLNVLSI